MAACNLHVINSVYILQDYKNHLHINMIIYHVAINKSKINIIMLFVEKKKVVHIIVSYVGIVMVHLACRMSITIFSKTYYKLV